MITNYQFFKLNFKIIKKLISSLDKIQFYFIFKRIFFNFILYFYMINI